MHLEYRIYCNNAKVFHSFTDHKILSVTLALRLSDESNAEKKVYLQKKIAEYMSRAEEIKDSVRDKQSRGQIVDKIHILANGSGYSYDTLFGKYLDSNVKEISLEEPYLRDFYQVNNNNNQGNPSPNWLRF